MKASRITVKTLLILTIACIGLLPIRAQEKSTATTVTNGPTTAISPPRKLSWMVRSLRRRQRRNYSPK